MPRSPAPLLFRKVQLRHAEEAVEPAAVLHVVAPLAEGQHLKLEALSRRHLTFPLIVR